jgi:hypothetical protein
MLLLLWWWLCGDDGAVVVPTLNLGEIERMKGTLNRASSEIRRQPFVHVDSARVVVRESRQSYVHSEMSEEGEVKVRRGVDASFAFRHFCWRDIRMCGTLASPAL